MTPTALRLIVVHMPTTYERPIVATLSGALRSDPGFLHILTGPRQVGKTTAARTVLSAWPGPAQYAAADELVPTDGAWLQAQWDRARRLVVDEASVLLVLDEVQKIRGWSEAVKGLWDADRARGLDLRVLLLGSSALRLAAGTSESLAGRFMLHRCSHWPWWEAREAFGWSLERWIFFGGYPGTASLADREGLWKTYIRDALVEPVLARDILALQRVTKPALLRNLFGLACRFPAQALSYTKMLGQLQDAGNTTTLAEYLRLLEAAFLVSGLERFSPGGARQRGSSPKLIVWNNALVSALDLRTFEEARADAAWWGRLVENAVGAHLVNHLRDGISSISWWRSRGDEVDFVVQRGGKTWAVEVKSSRGQKPRGLEPFARHVPAAQPVIVGPGGLPLETFFDSSPDELLR